VNYALPARWMMTNVDIATHHGADPDLVRRLAMEAAAETEGVLSEPAPIFLADPGALPTHLQFKLMVAVADRLQVGLVRSNIRLALIQKFTKHDVAMPVGERLIGWP